MNAPSRRVTSLLREWDAGDYNAIQFIRAATGRVHVVVHNEDRSVSRTDELLGGEEAAARLRFLLGETQTVCGARFMRHRGGFDQGASLVSHFPDEALCTRCHTAFGNRGVVIFEANQNDGRAPTQLDRLMGDTTTRNPTPLQ